MKIRKGKKVINIGEVKKVNSFGKVVGLMFSRRERANPCYLSLKNQLR